MLAPAMLLVSLVLVIPLAFLFRYSLTGAEGRWQRARATV